MFLLYLFHANFHQHSWELKGKQQLCKPLYIVTARNCTCARVKDYHNRDNHANAFDRIFEWRYRSTLSDKTGCEKITSEVLRCQNTTKTNFNFYYPRRGKCHTYFLVIVVLAQQTLACFRKIAGEQSGVLWIHDVQKFTIAWWFETKENYNEDNKQHKCISTIISPSWRWKLFRLIRSPSWSYVKWDTASSRCYGNLDLGKNVPNLKLSSFSSTPGSNVWSWLFCWIDNGGALVA